ncbi:MAG: folylpolyglutamate synthase/dihydrofolate synthase family protein, partial [Pseudorhodoplanes sp.]
LLLARYPADILLLEVGLGGRLDATTVIDRPLVSVIAPVSLDHAEYLGDTLEGVAAEKAGIIKRGIPVVSAPQMPEALAAIERVAARLRAPLHVMGEQWQVSEERGRLVFQDEEGLLDLPAPKLFGRHQAVNAGTALAALRAANLNIPPQAYERGLQKAEWPARMQRLTHGALIPLVPAGAELWLDGGHNPEGGRAVAAAIADLEERVPRPLVLLVGMLASKDYEGFLRNFSGLAHHLFAVEIPGQAKSLPAAAVADAGRRAGIESEACGSIEDALRAIGDLAPSGPPRILIAGSLYLAGEILRRNGTLPE